MGVVTTKEQSNTRPPASLPPLLSYSVHYYPLYLLTVHFTLLTGHFTLLIAHHVLLNADNRSPVTFHLSDYPPTQSVHHFRL